MSLNMLGAYGSSSEDDEGIDSDRSQLPQAAATAGQGTYKVALPSAADMFKDDFVMLSSSRCPLKRSAEEAFDANIADTINYKSSYIRVESDPLKIKSTKDLPMTTFKPPQLKRPNTVTEETKLWNSLKQKGEKKD